MKFWIFFKISGICGKSFHSGIWGLSKTAPWEFSLMRFLEMAVFIREARCRRGFAASRLISSCRIFHYQGNHSRILLTYRQFHYQMQGFSVECDTLLGLWIVALALLITKKQAHSSFLPGREIVVIDASFKQDFILFAI